MTTKTERLWIATVCALPGLLAALVAFAGVGELPALRQEAAEGFDGWLRSLGGVLEVVGAVAGLVPGLARFAAVWLTAVMAGAVINLTRLPPAALGGLVPLVAYARRLVA